MIGVIKQPRPENHWPLKPFLDAICPSVLLPLLFLLQSCGTWRPSNLPAAHASYFLARLDFSIPWTVFTSSLLCCFRFLDPPNQLNEGAKKKGGLCDHISFKSKSKTFRFDCSAVQHVGSQRCEKIFLFLHQNIFLTLITSHSYIITHCYYHLKPTGVFI